jgi:uncharacterized protein (DUF1499 family)
MRPWKKLAVFAGSLLLAAGCASTNEVKTGVQDGKLLPCPKGPKCVSSQSTDERHRMEPIPYTGELDGAREIILNIVEGMERYEVITIEQNYLYVQFRSKVVGYIDDVEFYIDEEQGVIHFRSSARFGYYDWKVNRKRMEYIRDEFVRMTGSDTTAQE